MEDTGRDTDIEAEGVDLAKQGRYAEARDLFERALATNAQPFARAQLLRNIALTHEREGNIERAIQFYEQVLLLPGLSDSNEGVYLRGQVRGHLSRLRGGSPSGSTKFHALLASYFAGSATGAALGAKVKGAGYTLLGQAIDQDLRYGGACLGAILGVFLFFRIMASVGPGIPWLGGIACAALTAYILLQEDTFLGLVILGFLILVPILLGGFLAAKFRDT